MKKKCDGCNGMCCRYVAIEIDCPEDSEDFENIKWYVSHKNVNVFVNEDDKWYVEFITPCEFLDEKNLCTIYERRPKICKNYDAEECLYYNGDYAEKYSFKKLEDVEDYIKNVFKKGKHVIPEDED